MSWWAQPTVAERASRSAVTAVRTVLLVTICLAVLGTVVVAVAVVSPLQEVSFRWMGLAGVALPAVTALAAVATLAGVGWSASSRGSTSAARWGVLTSVLSIWLVAAMLAWPTLDGMLHPRDPGTGLELVLAVQNLWYRNEDPAGTARAVMDLDADVLVLVEYTPQHAAAFSAQGASTEYPHRWEAPAELGSGLAVLSRVPLGPASPIPTRAGGATMELLPPGASVTLSVVHPISPRNRWGLVNWIKDYMVLRSLLDDVSPSTIVAGDFNATGAHRRYRELLDVSGLGDAQDLSGSGFGATWPSAGRFPPLMRLDRVLVGDSIGVERVQVLQPLGADHRGVLARLRLPLGEK